MSHKGAKTIPTVLLRSFEEQHSNHKQREKMLRKLLVTWQQQDTRRRKWSNLSPVMIFCLYRRLKLSSAILIFLCYSATTTTMTMNDIRPLPVATFVNDLDRSPARVCALDHKTVCARRSVKADRVARGRGCCGNRQRTPLSSDSRCPRCSCLSLRSRD